MTIGRNTERRPATVAATPGLLSPNFEASLRRHGLQVQSLASTANEGIESNIRDTDGSPGLGVALVDGSIVPSSTAEAEPFLAQLRASFPAIVLVGPVHAGIADFLAEEVDGWLMPPLTSPPLFAAIKSALRAAATRGELAATQNYVALKEVETRSLYEVGTALSAEHDLGRLQDLILRRCRELTSADAGSLYITDEQFDPPSGAKRSVLLFEIAQNDSISVSYQRFEIEVSKESIAGYVALTGQTLNIPDVYHLPPEAPYHFNRSIDESTGYRTKSMLVVPLRNHDGDIVGVIQLINCKRSFQSILCSSEEVEQEVIPFPGAAEQVLDAFAGHAASALNNRILLDSIERLFEGFVTASVKAIEARDPSTSGHSARVAELTVGIASAVSEIAVGRWKDTHLTEHDLRQIRYAGMLHDFGKIGVREHVLLKAKKLTAEQLGVVRFRFAFARKALEAESSRHQVALLLEQGRERFLQQLGPLEADYRDRIRQLDDDLAAIVLANEPTVLDEDHADQLADILTRRYLDLEGTERPLLEAFELLALSVRRGSLTETERRHIESHVQQTYDFLALMPWTRQLQQVPLIAWAHHEKLDGTGYPQGLRSDQIPLPSKMMAISDIYDALTASDRPYKPAMPVQRALDILSDEAHDGKLDMDLLDVFIQRRVYELTAPGRSGALLAGSTR